MNELATNELCQYVLIRSKRKGQKCNRVATKKDSKGDSLCLVHWRMKEAQEMKPEEKQDYQQLNISQKLEKEEEDEVLDYGTLAKAKK